MLAEATTLDALTPDSTRQAPDRASGQALATLLAFLKIDAGMTLNAAIALLMIQESQAKQEPLTTSDISKALNLAPPTVTRLMTYLGEGKVDDGFQGLDLIRMDIDKKDRRRRTLTLNSRGQKVLASVMAQAG